MRVFILMLVFWLLAVQSSAHAATGDALNRNGLVATFADEFDRFSWFEESTGGKRAGIWRTNFGYGWTTLDDVKNHTLTGNKEEQLYVDPLFRGTSDKPLGLNAIQADKGILTITASKAPEHTALSGYHYLSGLITTEPTFTQTYGVFEMRAKLPKGKGLWPAFWLLAASKKWPPEIDVMEVLGHDTQKYFTTLHYKNGDKHGRSNIPPHAVPDLSADFHTYAVDWGPETIAFYFDGKEVARAPTPPDMHQPFYMLINLAVGGSWPGSPDATTPFPSSMQVDWVRVWERKSTQR